MPEKINDKFHKNCGNTGKIIKISCERCIFVKFDIYFILRKALRWDKVIITIRSVCIVQYRIVFSFHLAKRINHPYPGWDREVRYRTLDVLRWPGVLWSREQALRSKMNWARATLKVNFDPGKTRSMLVYRPCDFTSGNLNKTSVREKFRGVYLPIGWVFPSYSMIFRLC